jgi:hypothetical protein
MDGNGKQSQAQFSGLRIIRYFGNSKVKNQQLIQTQKKLFHHTSSFTNGQSMIDTAQ